MELFTLAHAAAVVAVGGSSPVPPILPQRFSANFTEYTAPATRPPPYVDGVPDAPFKATRGFTYYDWSRKAQVEVRYDYCVNIFPEEGNDYPCTFFNVDLTSYLLRKGGCCVFERDFHPARPDFLRTNVTAVERAVLPWAGQVAHWWEVPEIPAPTGPFWYSFAEPSEKQNAQVYLSFSFPGVEGWVQQNFFNVKEESVPSSMWALPAECSQAKQC